MRLTMDERIIYHCIDEIFKNLRRIQCQLSDKPCSCEKSKVEDEPIEMPLNDR